MKKIAIVLGVILLIILILIGGLSLYLTDERLRARVLPAIQDATGRDVQIDRISYTLFRTFPRFGLVIEGLDVPDPVEERLATADKLTIVVNLMPLLRSEVSIHRLLVDRPVFIYRIYEDGTTNLDDFLSEDDVDEPATLPDLDLSEVIVTQARFGMQDDQSGNVFLLNNLDLRSSLRFSSIIESSFDLRVGSMDITLDGQQMISGLGFSLSQTSTLDLEEEILNLRDGQLNLLGLGLRLDGSVSDWGGGEPMVDLKIDSDSDDFGALLDLVPPDYEELIGDLETGGGLEFVVTISGRITEDEVPAFNARASITDGFIRHSDVPERISDITLSAEAVNDLITIRSFEARAGETRISASGEIRNPLEENARFRFSGSVNADLSTADRYVPLEEFDITSLAGLIQITADANGPLWKPEDSQFNANVKLSGGSITHTDISRPVEQIEVDIQATHQEVRIVSASARSSDNNFSVSGRITSPLDMDAATFRFNGNVGWDLATVGEYYPIDKDTLDMRGKITLSGSASGRMNDPENADFNLNIGLANGYVSYHQIGHPIEQLTANAQATRTSITIANSAVQSGTNRFSMTGSISNYMEPNASFDVTINGLLALDEMNRYYPLEDEMGLVMDGRINSEVRLRGRIDDLEAIRLDGTIKAQNVNMESPDLMLPLKGLNGDLVFRGDELRTDQVRFYFGETDYNFSGSVRQYKSLMYEPGEAQPAQFSGTFRSEFFNADEFMDFEEAPEPEPFDASLPNLAGSLNIDIKRMQFFAMEATDIKGTIEMSPKYILSNDASLAMYGGTMNGRFRWDIFAVDRTGVTFTGNLADMRVEQLFVDFDLGGRSKLAEHVRANFNTSVDFYAEFDHFLEMDMMKLRADGDFGMEEARISNHPLQNGLAGLLGQDELRDLALDQWTAKYDIKDGIMTLEDFNLTSKELGLNLNGTQNLIDDQLNYVADIVLPGAWAGRIGNTLPGPAADALRRDDGMLVLPISIRGTSENPRIGFDESKIQERLQEYLRDRATEQGREVLDGVLDRLRRN